MNRSSTPRYCRCGTRLAGDHTGERCNSCQKRIAALRTEPPSVPSEFWESEQLGDAFVDQHIGGVSRAYRKHPHHVALYGKDGIPQEIVGGWLNLTQAQISRIENGPPIRHLDSLAHWAKALRIPPYLLWFRLPGSSSTTQWSRETRQDSTTMPIQSSTSNAFPSEVVKSKISASADASAIQAFRAADMQVGGGHLYATVIKYLHTEVAPRLFDAGHDSQPLFAAAAALTEMAGWMAHDAGRDRAAQAHFRRSLDLVQVGGDRQLCAHILASMSHLAHHLDQPEAAIRFARRGRTVLLSGPPQPEVEARLLAMQARGLAAFQEARECTQLLTQAERALSCACDEEPSRWMSGFDEGSLASEAARCMRQLGDLGEAQRQAERIITLRPADRTRSRALGQLILVTVLIGQGNPDEACAVAQDVLHATRSLGSYLVIQQLLDLKQLLEPHRANQVVAEFLGCLGEAWRERMWLYRWLTRDEHSDPPGLGVGA